MFALTHDDGEEQCRQHRQGGIEEEHAAHVDEVHQQRTKDRTQGPSRRRPRADDADGKGKPLPRSG